jgi:hypothetical protein
MRTGHGVLFQEFNAIGRRLRRMHLVAGVDPGFFPTDDYSYPALGSSLLSPLVIQACPAHMETWLYTPMIAYAAKLFDWVDI